MNDLTEITDSSVFSLEPIPVRPYEKDRDVVMELSIERNLDLLVIAREGYTLLDFLSDLGGLSELIHILFGIILSFWNYLYLENFLVSRLYRLSNK